MASTSLFRLMGAVDITARMARLVLRLEETLSHQGWTNKTFPQEVRKVDPWLADLLASTDHRRTLEVLPRLRNTIHHTSLPEIRVPRAAEASRPGSGCGRPKGARPRAADALGGREAWGVNEATPNEFHVDPGRLADQLAIHAARLIVAVQDATPVERLIGIPLDETFDFTSPLDDFGDRHLHARATAVGAGHTA